jgi:hypothetical protein
MGNRTAVGISVTPDSSFVEAVELDKSFDPEGIGYSFLLLDIFEMEMP